MNEKEKYLFWKDIGGHISEQNISRNGDKLSLTVSPATHVDALLLFGLKFIGLNPKVSPANVIESSGKTHTLKELSDLSDFDIKESETSLSLYRKLTNLYFYLVLVRPELIEFIKFGMVGVSGMVVDLLLVTFFKEVFSYDVRFCSILAFPFAVTSNYILNCLWTFKGNQKINFFSYIKFFFTNIIGLAVRVWSIHLILMVIPRLGQKYYVAVTMMGILVAFFVNFLTSKFLVFQKGKTN